MIRRATASAPGSCGELAQGMLRGDYFLVSCPIDMRSTASVELAPGNGRIHAPASAPKARRAVALTLAHLGRSDLNARLSLQSPLPRGKGMASSTADIAAAIAATAAALRVPMPPALIAQLALRIEPSDGVMLPGIALFDHKRGKLAHPLGDPPPMRVLALDFGGGVDTLAFNRVNRDRALKRLQPAFKEALALVKQGIRNGSAADVGAGATLSALTNQPLLHKPQLDAALRLARQVGGVGVNAAHSGGALGILLPDDPDLAAHAQTRARQQLRGVQRIHNRRVIGGGVITCVPAQNDPPPSKPIRKASQWQT